MISKPLFKQSVKANWGIWTAITAATCFMFGMIIIVVGGNSINNIMSDVGAVFVKNSIRCEIEKQAMGGYIQGYETAVNQIGADFTYMTLEQIAALQDNVADSVAESLAEPVRNGLLENAELNVTAEKLDNYGFTIIGIKEISATAINKFRAQFVYEYPNGNATPQQIETIINGLTKSVIEEIPERSHNGVIDMKEMDLAKLMIGSMFFKIAGLLLPVIYIIMVSISLISGQVDSGSMAYIVSTPTKRRTVSFTQTIFLAASLFIMSLLVMGTGLISLLIIGGSSISYLQMILLSASYFITLFAFAGICFLASAWFNRSKHAMAIGGGLSMYFVVASIMGLFGSKEIPSVIRMDSMNLFNYTTITGLFDTSSILADSNNYLWKLGVLMGIGILGFAVGMFKFDKKDLPL